MTRRRRSASLLAGALALTLLALVAPAQSASAVSNWPGRPANIKHSAVTTTSLTVTLDVAANTPTYRLWISPDKNDLWVSSLSTKSTTRRAYSATRPSFSVASLTYRAAPYYYRIATEKNGNRLYSGIIAVSLRPTTPTDVQVVRASDRLQLWWSTGAVTHLEVKQATDPAMTAGVKTYRIRDKARSFTPYGLTTGTTYYFRVRALNGPSGSPWSAVVSGTPAGGEADLRVVTYNLLILTQDGKRGGDGTGEVIQPWMTKRKPAAAALLRAVSPDIVATQESSAYTAGWNSPRMVDTLASALGSQYTVARTQGLATDPDYILTGSHIVYRNTVLEAVGQGGHWSLPDGKYAAWQVLRHKANGAEVLAVSTHFTTKTGASYDTIRRSQSQALVDAARAKATAVGGIPIVYAGDVGSVKASWHPYDPPGVVMVDTRALDALNVAQTVTNSSYNSVNRYLRTPPKGSGSYDRIFTSPGIGVKRWNQLLTLVDGKFAGTIPSDHNPVVADLVLKY